MTERAISDRLFRVAALGHVPDDDQHVIAEANERIEQSAQHLGWIRICAEGMNVDNWLDMRDRIIRQLNQAEHGHGELRAANLSLVRDR